MNKENQYEDLIKEEIQNKGGVTLYELGELKLDVSCSKEERVYEIMKIQGNIIVEMVHLNDKTDWSDVQARREEDNMLRVGSYYGGGKWKQRARKGP